MFYDPPAVFSVLFFTLQVYMDGLFHVTPTQHADLVPSSTHQPPTIPSLQTSSSSYLAPRSTYQQTSSTLLTSSFSPSPTPTVVSYTFMSSEGMKVSATGYIYI